MAANERKFLRCAVYTRKSSEHGLEQDFNSLDAQREAAEAYIKSQAHEGWRLLKTCYDDGGLSGGTLERPALQTLLADIRARKVDIVVVYKVDRLTRSLADFAKLVEVFEAHGVSFVAVTQQFNTTSSMGRLTLNVLLSFAQFERELAGERIRDKFAASRRKGMWMGGTVPLGYEVTARKLVINAEEAERVRVIFERYLALGCVSKLREDLEQRGIRSKQRVLASGRVLGGGSFGRGALYHLLQSRIYLGEVVHKGISYPGEHERIIDDELWSAVEARLLANRGARRRSTAGDRLSSYRLDLRPSRQPHVAELFGSSRKALSLLRQPWLGAWRAQGGCRLALPCRRGGPRAAGGRSSRSAIVPARAVERGSLRHLERRNPHARSRATSSGSLSIGAKFKSSASSPK